MRRRRGRLFLIFYFYCFFYMIDSAMLGDAGGDEHGCILGLGFNWDIYIYNKWTIRLILLLRILIVWSFLMRTCLQSSPLNFFYLTSALKITRAHHNMYV